MNECEFSNTRVILKSTKHGYTQMKIPQMKIIADFFKYSQV